MHKSVIFNLRWNQHEAKENVPDVVWLPYSVHTAAKLNWLETSASVKSHVSGKSFDQKKLSAFQLLMFKLCCAVVYISNHQPSPFPGPIKIFHAQTTPLHMNSFWSIYQTAGQSVISDSHNKWLKTQAQANTSISNSELTSCQLCKVISEGTKTVKSQYMSLCRTISKFDLHTESRHKYNMINPTTGQKCYISYQPIENQ